MAYYESVFISRPDITAAQVEALTDNFKSIIDDNGGAVTKTEYWGLKTLAYRIKKNRKGHYSLLNLDAPAAAVKEYERNLQISEDILRFMTVRVDDLEEGPSIVMQNRSRRDEGRRDEGRGDGRRGDRPRSDRPRDGGRPVAAAASGSDKSGETAKEPAKPEASEKPAAKGGDE